MERLGREVIERMTLAGDEAILDAGCGSGRVTERLVERVPRGRVVGVDGSQAMIDAARERLGDRVELRVADLLELRLAAPVDVVFSTATFHWIADHERLFARLRAALRPGGRLVAQCGGAGNVVRIHAAADAAAGDEPFAPSFADWHGPWHFATAEATADRLRAAGFDSVRTWLEPRPVTPDDPREWLRTIILGSHLERLPAGAREPYVDAVLARLPPPVEIDYVRLNVEATAA